jgi:protein-L-isoaspartate(D-aspartate) O-methyltransferase
MTDFARARRIMVDSQIRTSDVTDIRVIDAFLAVPREEFVPAAKRGLAYLDLDLAVSLGPPRRCLLQPMLLARLIQAAEIASTDRILDVGAATGYSSAILSEIGASVVALESDPELAAFASKALASRPLRIEHGALTDGFAAGAPYDVIVVEGSVERLTPALEMQLAEGGRLVTVVSEGRIGRATVFVRSGRDVAGRIVFDASAAALPGFAFEPSFAF